MISLVNQWQFNGLGQGCEALLRTTAHSARPVSPMYEDHSCSRSLRPPLLETLPIPFLNVSSLESWV